MKAFLSHSSKDKFLVTPVFKDLGAANSFFDAESFEDGKRSAEEIFRSLDATDVFVLFVSRNSLASSWVKHELQVAYDRFAGEAGGQIFPLDKFGSRRGPRVWF